jgi:predicted CDP-diglyceride synthetase/phosphatidate cytidylyltransferase
VVDHPVHVLGFGRHLAGDRAGRLSCWAGLALSAVKRSIGAKDWGDMIEGHGGIPDRLDPVTFAAPTFFHIVPYGFM